MGKKRYLSDIFFSASFNMMTMNFRILHIFCLSYHEQGCGNGCLSDIFSFSFNLMNMNFRICLRKWVPIRYFFFSFNLMNMNFRILHVFRLSYHRNNISDLNKKKIYSFGFRQFISIKYKTKLPIDLIKSAIN